MMEISRDDFFQTPPDPRLLAAIHDLLERRNRKPLFELVQPAAFDAAAQLGKEFAYLYGHAEDAAQEAILIISLRLEAWLKDYISKPAKALRHFLYNRARDALRNISKTLRRQKAARERQGPEVLQETGFGGGHGTPEISEAEAKRLMAAFKKLPRLDRQIANCSAEGLGPSAIAKRLCVSEGTVRNRLKHKIAPAFAAAFLTSLLLLMCASTNVLRGPREASSMTSSGLSPPSARTPLTQPMTRTHKSDSNAACTAPPMASGISTGDMETMQLITNQQQQQFIFVSYSLHSGRANPNVQIETEATPMQGVRRDTNLSEATIRKFAERFARETRVIGSNTTSSAASCKGGGPDVDIRVIVAGVARNYLLCLDEEPEQPTTTKR